MCLRCNRQRSRTAFPGTTGANTEFQEEPQLSPEMVQINGNNWQDAILTQAANQQPPIGGQPFIITPLTKPLSIQTFNKGNNAMEVPPSPITRGSNGFDDFKYDDIPPIANVDDIQVKGDTNAIATVDVDHFFHALATPPLDVANPTSTDLYTINENSSDLATPSVLPPPPRYDRDPIVQPIVERGWVNVSDTNYRNVSQPYRMGGLNSLFRRQTEQPIVKTEYKPPSWYWNDS